MVFAMVAMIWDAAALLGLVALGLWAAERMVWLLFIAALRADEAEARHDFDGLD